MQSESSLTLYVDEHAVFMPGERRPKSGGGAGSSLRGTAIVASRGETQTWQRASTVTCPPRSRLTSDHAAMEYS